MPNDYYLLTSEFRNAFYIKFKIFMGYSPPSYILENLSTLSGMRFRCTISQCPFKWKYVMPDINLFSTNVVGYICYWSSDTYRSFIRDLKINIVKTTRARRLLRLLLRSMMCWYREKILVKGRIIARDTRDDMPDKVYEVMYHPRKMVYFTVAFSGRFPLNIEHTTDGHPAYVVHVCDMETTQEALGCYCLFTCSQHDGRDAVVKLLSGASSKDMETLEKTIRHLQVIGSEFMDNRFLNQYPLMTPSFVC